MNLEQARSAGILPTIPYDESTDTERFLITRELDLEQQIDQLYKTIHKMSEEERKLQEELKKVRASTMFKFSEFMLKHNVWVYPWAKLIVGFIAGILVGKVVL